MAFIHFEQNEPKKFFVSNGGTHGSGFLGAGEDNGSAARSDRVGALRGGSRAYLVVSIEVLLAIIDN